MLVHRYHYCILLLAGRIYSSFFYGEKPSVSSVSQTAHPLPTNQEIDNEEPEEEEYLISLAPSSLSPGSRYNLSTLLDILGVPPSAPGPSNLQQIPEKHYNETDRLAWLTRFGPLLVKGGLNVNTIINNTWINGTLVNPFHRGTPAEKGPITKMDAFNAVIGLVNLGVNIGFSIANVVEGKKAPPRVDEATALGITVGQTGDIYAQHNEENVTGQHGYGTNKSGGPWINLLDNTGRRLVEGKKPYRTGHISAGATRYHTIHHSPHFPGNQAEYIQFTKSDTNDDAICIQHISWGYSDVTITADSKDPSYTHKPVCVWLAEDQRQDGIPFQGMSMHIRDMRPTKERIDRFNIDPRLVCSPGRFQMWFEMDKLRNVPVFEPKLEYEDQSRGSVDKDEQRIIDGTGLLYSDQFKHTDWHLRDIPLAPASFNKTFARHLIEEGYTGEKLGFFNNVLDPSREHKPKRWLPQGPPLAKRADGTQPMNGTLIDTIYPNHTVHGCCHDPM
ncbi:hypothetical protein BT63DRAFT_415295 [Microthyrium microscopicum]|uniref:Uncharacterized protein n=1 Tax=Microthyrium microscopicum TaxID=703497 RepID=A0A6A6U695_9PEZI|nr:hypothetical protein BT63DRAFT_415295 [Microthyrium microscopicum]